MNLLILGGNSDIGLAIARIFAEKEGANITLASRNEEELERNASDIAIRYDVQVETRYFDARDFASHSEFYQNLPAHPDGVVFAFGYDGDQQRAQKDQQELKQIIETNYTGAATMLELVAADFQSREKVTAHKPFIIGISSAAGARGRKSNYIYGSAKAGFTALLSGLRQRLEGQAQVITLKPGFVDTKMTRDRDLPKLLLLSPEQVARKTYRAYKSGKSVSHITWYWWAIVTAVKMLPEWIYKKLDI